MTIIGVKQIVSLPTFSYYQAFSPSLFVAKYIINKSTMTLDIAAVLGLPCTFNLDHQRLEIGEDINCDASQPVSLRELTPTLLNKSLRYPENVYTHHLRLVHQQHLSNDVWHPDLRYDVFVLPNGLLGIEFPKTHIYYTQVQEHKLACILEIVLGEVTVILQKNKPKGMFEFDTYVDEVHALKVVAGEKIAIPTGYLFTFVNTGNNTAVFNVISTGVRLLDYQTIMREQGLAYFCISKNAKSELVANPRYRSLPQINYTYHKELINTSIPEGKMPLYEMALNMARELREILY